MSDDLITIDKVKWVRDPQLDEIERWLCIPFGSFTIANYPSADGPFKGWSILEVGCLRKREQGSREAAMKAAAPMIRVRAREIRKRDRTKLEDLESRCREIGA